MVSIRSLYGEHPGHGWKGTAGGMGMTGRAYGAVPKDEWIVFAAQLRAWCTAAGSIIADLG